MSLAHICINESESHEREDDNPVNFNSVTLLKRSENYEVIN